MLPGLDITWGSLAVLYFAGMLWSSLSWVRSIHENYAAANISSGRRAEKNRENALRHAARNTFREGIWCIPLWPLLVIRNLRSVVAVASDCFPKSKNESQHR